MKIEIRKDASLTLMKLIFYLSGEHTTLPKSEVLSLLRHGKMGGEVLEDLDQVLVCEASKIDQSLLERLGMVHEVIECIGSCPQDMKHIHGLATSIGPVEDTFSIRVTRIKNHAEGFSSLALEKSIGELVDGENVDLQNPEVVFRGFLTNDMFVLGKRIIEIKRSVFKNRDPKFRPFFHPSSLPATLSRTLCNICGVEPGKTVFDPFCGTGGILIEAGLLGATIHGQDIDEVMINGCKDNLSYFGVNGVVEQGDSTKIEIEGRFDIVITDPPYGRASTTMGRDLKTLYKLAVQSIYTALVKGGVACIISPAEIDLEEIALKQGFSIQETHHLRVHRSLTRKIVVMKK